VVITTETSHDAITSIMAMIARPIIVQATDDRGEGQSDQPHFEMSPTQQANGQSTKAKQTGSDSV
jgi:hypothetical protein